eukprot:UN16958
MKAYKNPHYINSRRGRLLRVMAEYEETEHRFEHFNIQHTILVFCSARGRSREAWNKQFKNAKEAKSKAKTTAEKKKLKPHCYE